jgi:hypothetical protein
VTTEDRLALRLHQIRRQAEAAIRRGEKLDPHHIHDLTTGANA